MTDLQDFGSVKLIDRNRWVLARQLDSDAGTLVTRKVRDLGLEVLHEKRVATIKTDADNNVTGILFEDGEEINCSCICFAVCFFFPMRRATLADIALDWHKTARRIRYSGGYPVCWKRWLCRQRKSTNISPRYLCHWGMRQLGEPNVRHHRPRYRNGRHPRIQPDKPPQRTKDLQATRPKHKIEALGCGRRQLR